MVPFRKLTQSDFPLVASFAADGGSEPDVLEACRSVAGGGDVFLTVVEGMLCMRQYVDGVFVYTWPMGHGNLRLVLVQLMEDAGRLGASWRMVGVPEGGQASLDSALPAHFDYELWTDGKAPLLRQVLDALTGPRPVYMAMARHVYADSLFYNNERMVPTVGEDGWDSK